VKKLGCQHVTLIAWGNASGQDEQCSGEFGAHGSSYCCIQTIDHSKYTKAKSCQPDARQFSNVLYIKFAGSWVPRSANTSFLHLKTEQRVLVMHSSDMLLRTQPHTTLLRPATLHILCSMYQLLHLSRFAPLIYLPIFAISKVRSVLHISKGTFNAQSIPVRHYHHDRHHKVHSQSPMKPPRKRRGRRCLSLLDGNHCYVRWR
jgi:hypothetical protein